MPQNAVLKRHNAVSTTLEKNFPGSSPRRFSSMSENDKKILLLRKEKFIPDCSCQVMKSNFDKTYGNSSLKKLQQLKNLSILSQQTSQNCTCGHVEWSFDNIAKIFLAESIEFPPKVQKNEPKKNLNLIHFPWKRWSGNAESCLETPAEIFLKNSFSFHSTSEEEGQVYNCLERTISLRSAAFDT